MRTTFLLFYMMLTLSLAQQNWSPKFSVSFSPLGGFAGLEFTTLTSGGTTTAFLGYDTLLNSHWIIQTVLRHENKSGDTAWGLQLGSWEHDPHLLDNTETAMGIQGDATLNTTAANQSLQYKGQLGLVHLQSYGAFQVDAKASAKIYQETLDLWDYRQSGYGLALTGLWGATPDGGVLGVWTDAYYTQPMSLFTPNDVAEVGLRAGYKPEEIVPSLRFSNWSALLSAGYRSNLALSWHMFGIASLERISLEPKLRLYYDNSLQVGTDFALGADIMINEKPSRFTLNLGYAEGFWLSLGTLTPF